MPIPSIVSTDVVFSSTLNSSHTQRITAANGAYSGTVITLKGCSISDVRMTLKVTLLALIDYQLINYYPQSPRPAMQSSAVQISDKGRRMLVAFVTLNLVASCLSLRIEKPRQQVLIASEAYDRLFSFIESDPNLLDKTLKYSDRSGLEQARLLKWAVHDPTFSQYLGEKIANNYGLDWVRQLSVGARQDFLQTFLIDFRGQNIRNPSVMAQLTQQLCADPEISQFLQKQYTAVQPT